MFPLPAEELITALQVLEVVAPYVAKSLLPRLLQRLDGLATLLDHQYKATRHMAARCLATLAHIASPKVMMMVVEKVCRISMYQLIISNEFFSCFVKPIFVFFSKLFKLFWPFFSKKI